MKFHSVCVVGAGGFIGSHLCEYLLEQGYQVTGVDLYDARLTQVLGNPRFKWWQMDYSIAQNPRELAIHHPVVINAAALCNPSLYNTHDLQVMHSNFNAPQKLADACAAAGTWLIHFSTSEIYGYGSATQALSETTPCHLGAISARRWSYATAKLLLERWLVGLQFERDLTWTVIRPFNVLGPRMDYIPGVDGQGIPRVLANFSAALLKGQPLPIVDGGTAQRAFTWVGDVVAAVGLMLQRPEASQNQCFNLGNPANEITMAQLAQQLVQIYREIQSQNPHLAPVAEPAIMPVSGVAYYGAGYEDSVRRLPDISKAQKLLDWHPQTDLATTLQHCLEWYAQHYGNLA